MKKLNKLKQQSKTIIIDEVDYLINNNVIEILRDLHDRSGCPVVLVGMANIDKKLSKYPHLKDRIYKSYKFKSYDSQDIKQIISELSEIPITPNGLEYLATRHNQFRQIVKLINKYDYKVFLRINYNNKSFAYFIYRRTAGAKILYDIPYLNL